MLSSKKKWLKDNFLNSKAIIFDFDNTLVDERFSVLKRWNIVLTKYEKILKIPNLRKCFFKIYNNSDDSYKYHLDDLIAELGIDKRLKDNILKDFLMQQSVGELVYPSVIKFLELLERHNFKMAMYTNGLKNVQNKRIELSGTSHFFEHIQYGDCSLKKPAPDGFFKLSKLLNLKSVSNFLMIGDNYDEDFMGASSIGACCILVNYKGIKKTDTPTYRSIDELYIDVLNIINNWSENE